MATNTLWYVVWITRTFNVSIKVFSRKSLNLLLQHTHTQKVKIIKVWIFGNYHILFDNKITLIDTRAQRKNKN